jgi:peroxiredoxin
MLARLFLSSLLAVVLPASLVSAQDAEWTPPGPEQGARFPDALNAPDQNGKNRSLGDLVGKKGVVIAFVRSADWCPFCMRQLVDLQRRAPEFEKLGFNVVSVSVDEVPLVKKFADSQHITYTMLADPSGDINKRLGIRDENYPLGSKAFGVPQPGIFVLDQNQKIIGKYFVQGYRERPDLDLIIKDLEAIGRSST